MKAFEIARRNIFWAVDYILGSKVKRCCSEIKFLMENFNTEEANKMREGYLSKLILFASKNVPFYNKLQGVNSLSQFPVVNKNIISDNYDLFRSLEFRNKRLYRVVTSGSTGIPFIWFWDERKKLRNTCDHIYFLKMSGFDIGERLVYLRVWNRFNKKRFLTAWLENIQMQDATRLSDNDIILLLDRLSKDLSKKYILGYSSSLRVLCQFLEKGYPLARNYNVGFVITFAEGVDDYLKSSLERYFSAPVFSRYSNSENGIIAQTCNNRESEYHINIASYIVEVLNLEDDAPAPAGTPGRIVITDLFNYAMPLIRYDTGDVGILSHTSSCNLKTPVFIRIEGRRIDMIYNTKGEPVTPYIIYHNIAHYLGVRQYQFIQRGENDYLLRLNCERNEIFENKLKSVLMELLGKDALINFVYVNGIPLLASGKTRSVLNLYKR